jgi:hypothetical protein
MTCSHVYNYRGEKICSLCGNITNETDWEHQNKLREQWLMDNPDAEYQGWMSI